MEKAILSSTHLLSLKLESIKIKDLSGFIETLMITNISLLSLEIVDCSTEPLRLTEGFFEMGSKL